MNGRRERRAAGARAGAVAGAGWTGDAPVRVLRRLLATGLATALATGAWHTPPFTTTSTKEAAGGEGAGAGRGERETRTTVGQGGRSVVPRAAGRPAGPGGRPGKAAGGPPEVAPRRVAESGVAGVGDVAWPVDGGARGRPVVERGFEPPSSPYGPGHRGVDLRAGAGQPVRAAAAGRVSFAGRVAGRGVLAIDHPGTGRPPLRTTYEPVLPAVRKGARVEAGQLVGHLQGGPYHCAAACLHWGLRRGPHYLDPLSLLPPRLLTAGHPRLLPVFGLPPPAGGG